MTPPDLTRSGEGALQFVLEDLGGKFGFGVSLSVERVVAGGQG